MSSGRLRVLHAPSVSELATAVGAALDGGPVIAPLPADPVVAERSLQMLRPELPVTEPDAAAVVSTSGSTGTPKGVVLSRTALRASADATARHLDGPGRWFSALPLHYVAGLMVVVRAVAAGQPVHDVGADLASLDAAHDNDRTDGPSYLSLVPTQLSRALQRPALRAALARMDAVLLGGAPAASDLLAAAREHGVAVVTTYGMSETCGGCVYDGVPLPGTDISFTTEPPSPASPSSPSSPASTTDDGRDGTGRIVIGGPMVFSGYRLRPDLTEQTLVDGRVRTGDRGSWQHGRLRVHGRLDDVIICGGMKIDLAAVERAAQDWPDLAGGEIVMIGVPDADWGTRLVAVAETADPSGPELDSLHAHLLRRLARHEIPKQLVTVATLPRTSSGKIDRRTLIERAAAG